MKKTPPIRHQLEEIASSQDFAKLDTFGSPDSWKRMRKIDRLLLARLFVMSGECQLEKNDPGAIETISKAQKLVPESVETWLLIGEAYGKKDDNARCLSLALVAAEKAAELDPKNCEALCLWGRLLITSGIIHQEVADLQLGENKLAEAEPLLVAPSAKFYWTWALAWYWMGEIGGEAVEFHKALDKMRTAESLGIDDAKFWTDFGNAFCEISVLIRRPELALEGVSYYEKAVDTDPQFLDGWLKLGSTLGAIYDVTRDETHFSRAYSVMQRITELAPELFQGWLLFGMLLTAAGKNNNEVSLLRKACEHFTEASKIEADSPALLRNWAEALMLWGSFVERLDLLREAEEKIQRTLREEPDDANAWYIYASCLTELGRYFNEEDYYRDAIEKYHYGISLDSNSPLLWHGLALAHFALGEQLADPTIIEQSTRYCERVIDLGGDASPQYWNDWGVAYMKLAEMTGDKPYVEMAIQRFEQAITRCRNAEPDVEWLYNYGCALDFLGDLADDVKAYEKAIEVLKQALEQEPDYVFATYNLALAHSHLGEFVGDIDHFYQALERFAELAEGGEEDEMLYNEWGLTLLNLAQLVEDPHQPEQTNSSREEAESKLMHAVSLGSIHAFYNLACLYAITGHEDSSMHFLERAQKAQALPPIDDLMNDEWLESIRQTDKFRRFIAERLQQEDA